MKRIIYIIIALVAISAAFSCKKDRSNHGDTDTITVYGSGYDSLSLFDYDSVAVIVDDSTFIRFPKITDVANKNVIHPYFRGFQTLICREMERNGGRIVTNLDQPVYIIAPASSKSLLTANGWLVVTNGKAVGEALYVSVHGKTTEVAIFSTRAYAGKSVTIPVTNTVFPPIPLAKKITYIETIE